MSELPADLFVFWTAGRLLTSQRLTASAFQRPQTSRVYHLGRLYRDGERVIAPFHAGGRKAILDGP